MNRSLWVVVLGLSLLGIPVAGAQEAPGSAGFSCGLDAAYIFLNRAGHHANYEKLVNEFMAEPSPDSLLAIKRVLEKHGCKVIGIKTDADFFLANKGPAIVFLQLAGYSTKGENHFSYLVSASRQDGVEFLDPIFQLRAASFISWDSFARDFQGIALIAHE